MKKLLLSLFLLVNTTLTFAQIGFSNFSTSNITSSSASLNAYVTVNCTNGGNFHAQFSTNASFAPSTNATGGSVFVSYPRTINISGLTPGTTYYWRYYGNLGTNCNPTVVYSPTQSFTTLPASLPPTIQNITIDANNTSANINYSLNANSASATSIVKYGLTDTSLTNQVTGGSATGSTNTPATGYLTGLTPNTTYYYQIEATNSIGTTASPVGSFTTTNSTPNSLVAEYNFNNTMQNIEGSNPFSTTSGTSFAADRNGNPNSALNITNSGSSAAISNLPYGASARTISIWVKMNSFNANFNFIYCYGTASNYNGAYFNPNNLYHFATGNNHTFATANSIDWTHLVFVYDGTQSKIYKNGVLLGAANLTVNTQNNNNIFTLGLTEQGAQNYFNGVIDDLKIYNYAISDTDANSLFTNNTLASEDFNSQNLQAIIYPNPTTDTFTIEMENEVQSVEIYSLQGQKVLISTSKNINVSDLSKGIYLVRIEDENNAVATQKLIVK
ncbi:LamG-like jellyroll fold domain-containing protein [Flavobacterium sp.]|uniref:LamG-like jellyroll fold domain-containing protein n=1 Tax=Flavobacterium sp. TaxID=239 RepID=UPI002B4AFEFB|nr:LamG-like jellyroll fold domain-containing protein [Flavobacterium sp.]HLP62913.1 LamG-like jellyroll fold domain-containing protein [Flavobacterium sp.]